MAVSAAELGEVLRAMRTKRNLSQDRVAALAGLHRNTISEIETAQMDPRMATLMRIAGVFDVPLYKVLKEAHRLSECRARGRRRQLGTDIHLGGVGR